MLPSTTTISSSTDPELPPQVPNNGVNPTHTPTTDTWSDEMDITIADPLPPTAHSQNPPLPPKSPNIPPPKPTKDFPFSFQSSSLQPFPSAPNLMPVGKERRPEILASLTCNGSTSYPTLNHVNEDPLGWIDAIGAITQILTIGVNNITSTQSNTSSISNEKVHIMNITNQLIIAATKLGNSVGCPTSPACVQTSLESKINEIHRKIDSIMKTQSSTATVTYTKATASRVQHSSPPRQSTPPPPTKKNPHQAEIHKLLCPTFQG